MAVLDVLQADVTGVGGFPLTEAARILVGLAAQHRGELEQIVFAVHGNEAEAAFQDAVERR